MLVLLFLMMLVIIVLLALVLMHVRRTAKRTEELSSQVVPAFVSATLALTDAQRTIRDILALVPMPEAEFTRSDAELDAAIDQAIGLTTVVERFAPVIQMHPRHGN